MPKSIKTAIPVADLPPEPIKPVPIADPPPATPAPAAPLPYQWGNTEQIRHSIRVICDEMGMTLEQKNTMCATIYGESEFVLTAMCRNYYKDKNGIYYLDKTGHRILASTDWGLCQWNDYYHGKEITPDEAVDNPEKAVRLMGNYWLRGQRLQWIAYKNYRYKQFLSLVQHPM